MINEAPTNRKASRRLGFYLPTPQPRRDGGCGRRRERADLVGEASLKDIELFVDRHLVKLAFGDLPLLHGIKRQEVRRVLRKL
jgi:hypothetical protein